MLFLLFSEVGTMHPVLAALSENQVSYVFWMWWGWNGHYGMIFKII